MNNTIFDYTEEGNPSNIKIVHDIKHHSYRITVTKAYHDNKAVASVIVPEDMFPFTYHNRNKIIR